MNDDFEGCGFEFTPTTKEGQFYADFIAESERLEAEKAVKH